jgi:hypothetical protein
MSDCTPYSASNHKMCSDPVWLWDRSCTQVCKPLTSLSIHVQDSLHNIPYHTLGIISLWAIKRGEAGRSLCASGHGRGGGGGPERERGADRPLYRNTQHTVTFMT